MDIDMPVSVAAAPSEKIEITGYKGDVLNGTDDFAKFARALTLKFTNKTELEAADCKAYLQWVDKNIGNKNGKADLADFYRFAQNVIERANDEEEKATQDFELQNANWSKKLRPIKQQFMDFLRSTEFYRKMEDTSAIDSAMSIFERSPDFMGMWTLNANLGEKFSKTLSTDELEKYLAHLDSLNEMSKENITLCDKDTERRAEIKNVLNFGSGLFNALYARSPGCGCSPADLVEAYFSANNYLLLNPVSSEKFI